MKKLFPLLFPFFILSCENSSQAPTAFSDSIYSPTKKSDSISPEKKLPELHDSISGDFDGDGKNEFAVLEMTKDGNLNLPASNDPAAEFCVIFRNEKIRLLNVGCCDIRLVKEEDLDADGADEISIFSNEGNGCTYAMKTYSWKNGEWKMLLEPFLIFTACNPISDKELQERVFRENGKIYFLAINNAGQNVIKRVSTRKTLSNSQ